MNLNGFGVALTFYLAANRANIFKFWFTVQKVSAPLIFIQTKTAAAILHSFLMPAGEQSAVMEEVKLTASTLHRKCGSFIPTHQPSEGFYKSWEEHGLKTHKVSMLPRPQVCHFMRVMTVFVSLTCFIKHSETFHSIF